jgi:NTP pyrophosphatase (non-canonical NTP hydrolase)
MNRLQYLLTKLAEEAVEVSQIALKTQQFGLEEVCPNLPYTNKQRIYQELDDLNAILTMLAVEFDFYYKINPEAVADKIAKVNKYYGYSKQLKQVE